MFSVRVICGWFFRCRHGGDGDPRGCGATVGAREGVSSADVVEPSFSMTLRYTIHSTLRDTLLILQSVVARVFFFALFAKKKQQFVVNLSN